MATYDGPPLEDGKTAGHWKVPAPAIKRLVVQGVFADSGAVLDYGAGHGRNTNYLRDMGLDVYAYDPYNSTGFDGWGYISEVIPNKRMFFPYENKIEHADTTKPLFDIGFTSYVLNVVPEWVEESITAQVAKLCQTSYHIVRRLDILTMAKKAIDRNDTIVLEWFKQYLRDSTWPYNLNPRSISNKTLIEFCEYGVQTIKGFQRLVKLDAKGFTKVYEETNYTIYKR